MAKKKYYISYLFTTDNNNPGIGTCAATFEHDIPSWEELQDLKKEIENKFKYGSVIIIGYFELYNEEITE